MGIKIFHKTTIVLATVFFLFYGCKAPDIKIKAENKSMPESYNNSKDSITTADINWKDFFSDPDLVRLIEVALKNNQELNITLQEIEIAKNNTSLKTGLLFPAVSAGGAIGVDKVGRYTSEGAGDAVTEITPGKLVPDPLSDYIVGLHTTWEIDVWKKLRNSRKAAFAKYLGSVEGKNLVVSNLVAEIANSYFELLSLDNQLDIVKKNIELQTNALKIVQVQKEAAMVTELAVKQFEAEVYNSQSLEYEILQQIKETENKINFLLGRFPQSIVRDKTIFISQLPNQIKSGIPSQLLKNRPDIRSAEFELFAAKCDVKAAQAEFYPSFTINGALGFQAFKAGYLFTTPESMIYNLVGDLTAPLINRSAIKAEFNKAKAYQVEAMYDYEKTILNGYVEVSNELSNINNMQQLYNQKAKQVEALTTAIDISNALFKSAKADYLEVLRAQREALESKLELMEIKKRQFNAVINLYKALGGGWK